MDLLLIFQDQTFGVVKLNGCFLWNIYNHFKFSKTPVIELPTLHGTLLTKGK